jgi:hypothetical protein
MKKLILSIIPVAALFVCCSDEMDVKVPYPTNITFNELKLDKPFSHIIPDGGFTSQGIKFNTVKSSDGQLSAGFCYSDRSDRSFVWHNDVTSMDSIRYSVWTTRPNTTETYLVCHVSGDDAFFTLDKPSVIDYILVDNTSWDYLAMTYGDSFGTAAKPEANPNIPSAPKGIWYSYVPGGVKKFAKGDYFRLTAKGYNNNQLTGSITFDLACMGVNKDNPGWSYVVSDWTKMDLTSLGTVNKVVFYLESTDVDVNGVMRTPSWFCLDGFQLKNE